MYYLPSVIDRTRTIQRRISDSVDFNRGWDDYVNGFGEEDGNYWMGLEEIHQLTTANDMSLDINIETFEGEPFTMTLETFSVDDAAGDYAWHFSGYSQSADRVKRDNLFTSENNGLRFTTQDRDLDSYGVGNCATDYYRGGWWYATCGYINLNGNYEGDVPPSLTGISVWYIDTDSFSYAATKAVKTVEMIIRAREE